MKEEKKKRKGYSIEKTRVTQGEKWGKSKKKEIVKEISRSMRERERETASESVSAYEPKMGKERL